MDTVEDQQPRPPVLPPNESDLVWDDGRLSDPHHQPDKAQRVRTMFDRIAPTYSLVNRVMSLGRDAYWRRRAVALAQTSSADRILDIACGTGDFAQAFLAANPQSIVGCDFSRPMLAEAARRGLSCIRWCQADALNLPFADSSQTLISCAFGVRNFQDLDRGLAEMYRVLRPEGRVVILEFSLPRTRLIAGLYRFYFHRLLPRLATLISRDRTGAYRYLPRSVSAFDSPQGLSDRLRRARFTRIDYRPLTGNIVALFVAWKG